MKHFWFGAGLLAVLLAVGLWTSYQMDSIHSSIADTLNLAAQTALSGDPDAGYETARQARDRWEMHRHATAAVADHTPMEEADSLFSQLESFIDAGDPAQFSACCTQLAALVRAIGQAHTLTWWNLLTCYRVPWASCNIPCASWSAAASASCRVLAAVPTSTSSAPGLRS